MNYIKIFAATFIIFLLSFSNSHGQQNDSVATYDIVYLTEGGTIEGEILSFNESDGFLVIRDNEGRKFSLSKSEYKYFVENQRVEIKKKKELILKPRKEDVFEFGVGFEIPFFFFFY